MLSKNDMVLPIYYRGIPSFRDSEDSLIRDVADRIWIDRRSLVSLRHDHPEYLVALDILAGIIISRIHDN